MRNAWRCSTRPAARSLRARPRYRSSLVVHRVRSICPSEERADGIGHQRPQPRSDRTDWFNCFRFYDSESADTDGIWIWLQRLRRRLPLLVKRSRHPQGPLGVFGGPCCFGAMRGNNGSLSAAQSIAGGCDRCHSRPDGKWLTVRCCPAAAGEVGPRVGWGRL